ncbi:MAG TPA: GGDEF domain-containing protein [Candidatus Limnocylindrales bacterium]|nr:GGDEF domain-containing protein [Candidatus Limnocylindrales bacterium]
MPSPGALAPPRLPIEDSYLELLADTLEGLDLSARGQFLQRYLRAIAHLDLTEAQSVQVWDEMLVRRLELSGQAGRKISLKSALLDVLASSGLLRVPIVIEYEDLKKLELNAVTDPLTGLYNRRLFEESFEKELNRARRYGQPLGLVILDLHRFKEVNDKHGHPRGDEVLRATAATLKKALRTSDSAFRIGGDEFALLLPQTDSAQALALSRRVEAVFSEMVQPLQLAVSVGMDHGVAIFPQDAEQADQLIRIADERLYRQKHANHTRPLNGAQRVEPQAVPETVSTPPPVERVAPPPQPISIETKRPEKTETTIEAAASATSAAISADATPSPPRVFAVQRKAERVSMTGTNAYAVLGEQGGKRARVLDLGFGGVAIELDSPEDLPDNLLAVLHVPILPPVRVSLKPVWKQQTTQGSFRVGCAFIS